MEFAKNIKAIIARNKSNETTDKNSVEIEKEYAALKNAAERIAFIAKYLGLTQ